VLCSLANVQSNTAVEQLLGRVMRMPYAQARRIAALNKAYAYVLSPSFGQAADALVQKLSQKGFDENEARAVIQHETSALPLFEHSEPDKIKLDKKLNKADVPENIKLENNTLIFTDKTSEADIEKICQKLEPPKVFEIKSKFANYKKQLEKPSPAQQGQKFIVPSLKFEAQGEFVFADPETIFEQFD
jgi:type III restriction enzyme